MERVRPGLRPAGRAGAARRARQGARDAGRGAGLIVRSTEGRGGTDPAAVLGALGPAFAVRTHQNDAVPPAPWRDLSELLGDDAWAARTEAVRNALATMARGPVEERVAFSTAHLGVVARVLAPAFALAVVSGAVPGEDPWWWQPLLGGPPPLSLPAASRRVPPDELADAFAVSVVDRLVVPMTDAAARTCAIAPAVLRDNSASALNSSATMLATARPELAGRAFDFADALLRRAPWGLAAPGAGPGFRRGSCCLIYRISPGPPHPVCGDCVLPG